MAGFNGGFVGGSFLPTASQKQPGVWSLQEVCRGRVGSKWPSLVTTTAATGGDDVYNIAVGGTTYAVHQFSTVGSANFVLTSTKTVEYLIVGGGGAGGGRNGTGLTSGGGGGGAGGVLSGSVASLSPGTYEIVVGDGGLATGDAGGNGEDSSFNSFVAFGGGGGGTYSNDAKSGGSGGGGGITRPGGTGTSGQGNNGGSGSGAGTSTYTGGGGGGAGSAGPNGAPDSSGPTGGAGIASAITGTSLFYGGGGGGGAHDAGGTLNRLGGLGGIGGGGTAGNPELPQSGATGTGGGGGGGTTQPTAGTIIAGDGGSGIVIIRYVVP